MAKVWRLQSPCYTFTQTQSCASVEQKIAIFHCTGHWLIQLLYKLWFITKINCKTNMDISLSCVTYILLFFKPDHLLNVTYQYSSFYFLLDSTNYKSPTFSCSLYQQMTPYSWPIKMLHVHLADMPSRQHKMTIRGWVNSPTMKSSREILNSKVCVIHSASWPFCYQWVDFTVGEQFGQSASWLVSELTFLISQLMCRRPSTLVSGIVCTEHPWTWVVLTLMQVMCTNH